MERIKQQIISNLNKLNEEARDITNHINRIIKAENIVEEMERLSKKELMANKSYYLNLTEQQHLAIQKLLAINLDLEEFIENIKINTKPDVEKTVTNNCKDNHISDSYSDTSLDEKESSDAGNRADNSDLASDKDASNSPVEQNVSCGTIPQCVEDKLKSLNLWCPRKNTEKSVQRCLMPDLSFKKIDQSDHSKESDELSTISGIYPVKERRKRTKSKTKHESTNKMNSVEELKPIAVTIPDALEPHKDMTCLVSCIKNPSEFYINHLNETIEAIENISDAVCELYGGSISPYKSKEEAYENLGEYCLCYVADWAFWYRVKVTNWHLRSWGYRADFVTVYLIDYGHTTDVVYSNLRELLHEQFSIPRCAIRCHLAYVHPPGATKENVLVDWPESSLECFNRIIGKENASIFKVVFIEKMGDSWAIDLMVLGDDENAPSIGQKLIDDGAAVEILTPTINDGVQNDFIKKQIKTAQDVSGITAEMSDDQKMDIYCNNAEFAEAPNFETALTNYQATDEARICRQFRRIGVCYKGAKCKFEHVPLRKDGYTTDKYEVYRNALASLRLPKVGDVIQVRVTHIEAINSWYGQFTQNAEAYGQLKKSLNSSKTVKQLKRLRIPPTLGELVLAQHWMKKWYRAMIKDTCQTFDSQGETFQLFLVDTGEIVDVKMSDLRQITVNFLHTPFQAVNLRLHRIVGNDDVDSDGAVHYYEAQFVGQIFSAEVKHVSSSTINVVLQKSDINIGEQIVSDGYGKLSNGEHFPKKIYIG